MSVLDLNNGADPPAGMARRILPILLTFVIGVAASIGLLQQSESWRRQVFMLDFQNRAEAQVAILNTDLQDAGSILDAMRALFEARDQPVGRDEFSRFFSALRTRTIGLRDIGWAPHVTGPGREAFERELRDAGFANFQIRTFGDRGELVRAPDRHEYYPIVYADTGKLQRPAAGFDLTGDAVRRAAVGRAIATGRPAATPPIATMVTRGPRSGVLGYVPVYRSIRSGAQEGADPDGLVFAAFDIIDQIDNIVRARLRLRGVDLYLFDPGRPADNRAIYWRTAADLPEGQPGTQPASVETPAPRQDPAPDEQTLRSRPYWEGTVTMFDQKWGILFLPDDKLFAAGENWLTMLPAAVGLLLTAMILGYLVVSLRRTLQLEALTRSLSQKTEDLHQQAARIAYMARHDSLTGLPNRRVFAEDLEREAARAARGRTSCGVLLIDLDRFKPINDTHGHAVGDAVLATVAQRLRSVIRKEGVLARLGGDEFAAIVEYDAAEDGPAHLAQRLIATLTAPILVEGLSLSVGASIGIARCPADASDGDALLRAADAAMYRVKRTGRGNFCFFDGSMAQDVQTRSVLQAELGAAIAAGQIEPYFQPIVRLSDEAVVGVEILARWRHPDRGAIQPDIFIPLVEDAGLMKHMTYSLLRRACIAAADWPQHWFMALNISPSQLGDRGLPGQILAILQETGTPPARLEIEVTEAALITSASAAREVLLAFQAAGISVALDDFGTGYSSLTHLQQLSFDRIKIDRSFVMSLHDKTESAKIVQAIIGLSASLAIVTTAEGIENAATASHLAALGCEFGQGYHFGRPMTAVDLRSGFMPQPGPAAMGGDAPARSVVLHRREGRLSLPDGGASFAGA